MKEEKDNFLKDFYRRIAQSSEEISKSEEVNEIFSTTLASYPESRYREGIQRL